LLKIGSLQFDRNELAGAFGDLGTFIPLVAALIIQNGLDPKGVFLSFGLLYIYTALVFRVPIAVQPMKAIAIIMITQALQPSLLIGAGILIGIAFIVLAFSRTIHLINSVTPRSVVRGVQLGLGLNLILTAFRFMQNGWVLSIIGVFAVLVLFKNKRLPPALVLLAIGVSFSIFNGFPLEVFANNVKFDFPKIYAPANNDFVQALLVLVVPQIPLTISNAILATSLLCQDYFPDRRDISIKRLALSHGVMNLIAVLLGGIPVCHGAGGLAGHYRFGARSGGALVIIGVFMLVLGLLYSNAIVQILSLFPFAILGVMLLFTGFELTLTIKDKFLSKSDRFVALFVATLSIIVQYGYALGFVGGIVLAHLISNMPSCKRLRLEVKQ
jgi:MFS superfamily sulfate permease-like transporter